MSGPLQIETLGWFQYEAFRGSGRRGGAKETRRAEVLAVSGDEEEWRSKKFPGSGFPASRSFVQSERRSEPPTTASFAVFLNGIRRAVGDHCHIDIQFILK
jgi:hypothetical protein